LQCILRLYLKYTINTALLMMRGMRASANCCSLVHRCTDSGALSAIFAERVKVNLLCQTGSDLLPRDAYSPPTNKICRHLYIF
jgi:hypothetical protein